MKHELIAAVDLGSNSFRLVIGRTDEDQIYELDNLKEPVRLAAGLGDDRLLDEAAQDRAIEALRRFNERLRGFESESVRAVATNSVRVAKNAAQFLTRAQDALGFPIEVIAGREEARLIYVGVAHSLPDPSLQQLVVDIGGGSTEFIIGRNFEPLQLESLYMGCVSYSLRYFADGTITRAGLKEAELAARHEMQAIVNPYRQTGWELAVGSSGSAKAICDVLELNGLSPVGITRDGLEKLRHLMLKVGHIDKLQLEGLKSDRLPVFAGGFSIMYALFKELDIDHMAFSEGALRLGVLYDLLGRYHRHDLRDATVQAFLRRYQVDVDQAQRVAATAARFLEQVTPTCADPDDNDRRFLIWSALLHEIGLSVAHSSYHKHTAYILANADMPGFSRMDQARLARLTLAHRGKLERIQTMGTDDADWRLILCLRLAVIVHRSRESGVTPALRLLQDKRGYTAIAAAGWLHNSALTAAALEDEEQHWARLSRVFRVRTERTVPQAQVAE
jgi:exopolyphosphatase / guanosine-5'-triphosphate,3'-diphosphate pyrophosphatase